MAESLDNVPRVADLERGRLLADHAYPCQPVILTEAFERAPKQAIGDSLETVVARFGDLRLPFRPEYGALLLTCLRRGPLPEGTPDAVRASLAEYWQMVRADPETPVMCAEEDTPTAIAESVGIPRAAAGDDDMRSTLFVGNANNVAPIHFDGDCRHVLLHQLFGRKLVVMLPASAAAALRPVVNFSTLQLRMMAADDRQRLVRALGGWECVLCPGETVLMPAMVWHGVVYLDDGMSVNFRFGRHARHRFVSEKLHLDERVQAFAAATVDPVSIAPDGAHRSAWRQLVDCWAKPAPTPYAKYLQICECLAEITPRETAAQRGQVAAPWPDEHFATLPEIVVEALVRANLFNHGLYLHRSARDAGAFR